MADCIFLKEMLIFLVKLSINGGLATLIELSSIIFLLLIINFDMIRD